MRFLFAFDLRRKVTLTRILGRLVVTACAGVAGCAKPDALPALQVYEVKGKVLLADGKPLSGGSIYLVSKAGDLPVTPAGRISSDGTFTVITGGSGEGAPAGEYKVRIEAPPAENRGKAAKQPFPARYIDEDSSGIEVVVRAEANQLEPIRLK